MTEVLFDTNWEEHYIRRGDPTKPTYYIARRKYETTGLFARYKFVLGHVRYALSKGWIPVVDMQNYPNPYLAPEKLGVENSWEYYFEQPLRIGLEEAYAGENVVLSNAVRVANTPTEINKFFENRDNILAEWRSLIKNEYLKVKPALQEEILAVRSKLFSSNDRVLGVLLRGTDYVANKPKNHPIPPLPEFAASIADLKLREWNCNKIFLATEDKSFVQIFKKFFGEKCVTFDREYVDYKPGEKISLVRIGRENDYFQQGKDYVTQIVILSMCNSLVAARCGGSLCALIMSDHFENTYFFDLGRYGVYK